MSSPDNKDDIFPTRFGPAIGHAKENRMIEAVGGADGIRTRILIDGNRTTILKTRGGNPHFQTTETGGETVEPPKLFAVECSAVGGEGNKFAYVGFTARGNSRREFSETKWYKKYSYASRWVGTGDLDKEVIEWCGPDTYAYQHPNIFPATLTGLANTTATWDSANSTTWYSPAAGPSYYSPWPASKITAFSPPGSVMGWGPWSGDGAYTYLLQFSGVTTSTYDTLATARKLSVSGMHAVFKQMVGENKHTMTITLSAFNEISWNSGVSVLGTIYDRTAGTSKVISVPPAPSGYLNFGFSSRLTGQPLVVNGSGTRAICGVWVAMRPSTSYSSYGRAILDIDLVSGASSILSFPNNRRSALSMGFIEDELVSAWSYGNSGWHTDAPAKSGVGDKLLLMMPGNGMVDAYDTEVIFADYAKKLFIVAVNREYYGNDIEAYYTDYVVFLDWKPVATFHRVRTWPYSNPVIVEVGDGASGHMTYTTYDGSVSSAPDGNVPMVDSFSTSGVFTPVVSLGKWSYGGCSADLAQNGSTIAVSICVNGTWSANKAGSVWNGPRAINRIINVKTGTSKTFGKSDQYYYNRLHYQDVL